jgi:hypothetical protein
MADGAGEMILRILLGRQNLDELGAALDHLLNAHAIDQIRHIDILGAHVVKLREVARKRQERIELSYQAARLQRPHHEA